MNKEKVYEAIEGVCNYYQKNINSYQAKLDNLKKFMPRVYMRVVLTGLDIEFNAWGPTIRAHNFEEASKVCESLMDEFPELKKFKKLMSSDASKDEPEWYWLGELKDIQISVWPARPGECAAKKVQNIPHIYDSWVCER